MMLPWLQPAVLHERRFLMTTPYGFLLVWGQVHKPGVAAALARVEAEGLRNVKIVQGDAITALTDHIEDRSLSSCYIFFPDPFPQDRDSER